MHRLSWGLWLGLALGACAGKARQDWPAAAGPEPQAGVAESQGTPPRAPPRPVPGVPTAPPPETREVARARQLVDQGLRLYRQGDYEKAEVALKEAMTLYPFLADANLALGKIFLIRASATRDLATMNSARLMFEMARAIDPAAREADVLLELFQAVPE